MKRTNPFEYAPFHPLVSIIGLSCLFVFFSVIGQLFCAKILHYMYGYDLSDVKTLLLNPEEFPEGRIALLINHAVGTIIFGFITTCIVWVKIFEKQSFQVYFQTIPSAIFKLLVLSILITWASNPLNSILVAINKKMILPEPLSALEAQIKSMELNAEKLTQYLVDFNNTKELFLALLVMGILTGIGEELFFRGSLQNKLEAWFKNPHLAILVCAFIFSALHFQFYGFLPRMALAILFGYLYFWSRCLWVPIIAHTANNSLSVIAMYYTKTHPKTQEIIEPTDGMPWHVVLISSAFLALLLYYFYTENRVKNSTTLDS